jgi:hypothetical protein
MNDLSFYENDNVTREEANDLFATSQKFSGFFWAGVREIKEEVENLIASSTMIDQDRLFKAL